MFARMIACCLLVNTLAACGGAPACPTVPSAPPGTILGYDTSAGRKTTITVWSVYGKPGAPQVTTASEGDQVWVLERSADGGVRIETKGCQRGWIDSEFITP
jgi:hypothetical protein